MRPARARLAHRQGVGDDVDPVGGERRNQAGEIHLHGQELSHAMRRHDLAEKFRRYAGKRTIKSDLGRPCRTDSAYADRFCPQDSLPVLSPEASWPNAEPLTAISAATEPHPNSVLRLMSLSSTRSPGRRRRTMHSSLPDRAELHQRVAEVVAGSLAHAVRPRLLRISLYNLCACRCPYVRLAHDVGNRVAQESDAERLPAHPGVQIREQNVGHFRPHRSASQSTASTICRA